MLSQIGIHNEKALLLQKHTVKTFLLFFSLKALCKQEFPWNKSCIAILMKRHVANKLTWKRYAFLRGIVGYKFIVGLTIYVYNFSNSFIVCIC